MCNGNGDEVFGDGWCFCGCGLLQIIGCVNYWLVGEVFGELLEVEFWCLEQFVLVVCSVVWWWVGYGFNELVDCGEFVVIICCINGGLNGQVECLVLWQWVRVVLL